MKGRWLIPYTFVLMNWAAVAALYHVIRGTQGLWTPQPTVVGYYHVVDESQSKLAA